jgi:hypothetical protein
LTHLVAQLSVTTGIAPNDLLDAPCGMIEYMVDVLNERAKQAKR